MAETILKTPQKHAGGRPTDYDPKFAKIAHDLISQGSLMKELADSLEISTATLYEWISIHPEFADSIKKGKDARDSKVENSLFQRACGVQVQGVKGLYSLPPSEVACIFWLKNRRPAQWRDVQRVEVTGRDGVELFPSLSELKLELARRGIVDVEGRVVEEKKQIVDAPPGQA